MSINQQIKNVQIGFKNNRVQIAVCGAFVNVNCEQHLQAVQELLSGGGRAISIVPEKLQRWDSSLLSFVYEVSLLAQAQHVELDISQLPDNLKELINLANAVDRKPTQQGSSRLGFLEKIGKKTIGFLKSTGSVLGFLKEVICSIGRFVSFRSVMRRIDFYAALEDCGPKALAIVSLISFLVGLILAFVGAVQLQTFGAQIYVASLVTIGMCRIMGAIMVGIIMAGRTGSSYAATIGTMQVNEELDALQTMGLSKTDFLVLPRMLALILAMPILTMLSDVMGMIGGAFVGIILIGVPYQEYWKYAFEAFTLKNFLVGIFHGFCFGFIISLCGCYSGLTCGRNADSVGLATTKSVVCAIVWMIVMTGIITVICQELGL